MVPIRRRLWGSFQEKLAKRFISDVITEEDRGTVTS